MITSILAWAILIYLVIGVIIASATYFIYASDVSASRFDELKMDFSPEKRAANEEVQKVLKNPEERFLLLTMLIFFWIGLFISTLDDVEE